MSASNIILARGQSTQEYMLCFGDRDYYELQGCARGELDVIVNFDVNSMDIDLRLADATGRLLDSSALAGQIEQVSHYYAQNEPVYLEVLGYLDTVEGSYSITTTLTNCSDTPPECSTDNDCPSAEVCDGGQCIPAPQGCMIDADCAPSESCINAECVPTANRCDFDFDCPVGQVCTAGQCTSSISPDCTLDSDCLFGQICQAGACVNTSTLEDDMYEENDTLQTATSLESGSYQDLALLSGDEDYYALEVCAGGTLEASIFFSSLLGDLELRVEDQLEVVLDQSTSSSDSETVSWTNRGDQPVMGYVIVYGFLGDEGRYNLNLNVRGCDDTPVDPVDDDRFEENDIFQEATTVEPGIYDNLTRTSGDDDWYVVDVCEGGTITVDVTFSHLQGDLNAWLYDEAVLYLDGSLSSTDNESLSATISSSQSVYINVFSFNSDEADYQLNISVTGCIGGLAPDRLEENDTRETGELLAPNLYEDLTITNGDEDWILFDVCEGGNIDINLTFVDSIGDLDATLYDEAGLTEGTATSSGDDERIIVYNASAGRYALRVYGYLEATNSYDLQFSVTDCAPTGLALTARRE